MSITIYHNPRCSKSRKTLGLLEADQALATWLERYPKIIERPIVVNEANNKATIGRPPENIYKVIRK